MMTYEKYKETDLDWIEQLPSEWTTDRLKNIFSFSTGLSITKKDLQDKGIPCVNYGEIHSKYGFEVDPNTHPLRFVDEQYLLSSKKSLLKKGDFVFADTSEDIEGSGNFTHLISNDKVFAGYHTISAKPKVVLNSRFLAYLLDSNSFRSQVQRSIAGIKVFSITQGLLNRLSVIFPPEREQQSIALYLDTNTKAIDKKVKLLKQKIDYYKELRKSFINDAVTKGLDNSVELNTTEIGIEVPKTWNRYRLKDIGKLYSGLSGKSGDDFRQDNHPDNKRFIPFTNIAGNTYISEDNLGKVVVGALEKQNNVKKGDIFFLMSSEGYDDIGKSSVLDFDLEETYLNSFCKGFRLQSKDYDPHFINYLLQSDNYRQLLIIEGKGFTRINLKMEKINDFLVYLPSTREEQTEIAKYLYQQTETIDKIVKNILEQIDRLKELRKSLINDVVTGKIRVCESHPKQ